MARTREFSHERTRYRIRRLRLETGMTQPRLAAKLGSHASIIWHWERGDSMPGSVKLFRLAQALKTSTDYLLGLSDDRAQS